MRVLAGTSRGVFSVDSAPIDGGATTQVLESRGVRDLITIEGRLFAATGAGLHLSDDDGTTWEPGGLEDLEVWQVRGAGDGMVYATTQPAGLFRSDDAGDHWAEIESFSAMPEATDWCVPVEPPLPGRARALVIDAHDPQRIWVGVEVGGVMATSDGGATWKSVLPGDNPDLHMLFAHPDQPGTLFASTGYGRFDGVAEMVEGNAGVFRSVDHGETWTYAWAGVTPRYSRPMCIDHRSPYGLTVASAPTAFSNHREDGGARAMLFRSVDGGDSWRSLCDEPHTPSSANFHGLTTDPEHAGGVIVGTDTGEVWRVSDQAEWSLLGAGMPAVLSIVAY
ncbi:MAG: hypothetical protein OEV40_11510 [Acidimicrobiia bacterium]|nr:hypothetical protein [Acidimicrobiia bacterium]